MADCHGKCWSTMEMGLLVHWARPLHGAIISTEPWDIWSTSVMFQHMRCVIPTNTTIMYISSLTMPGIVSIIGVWILFMVVGCSEWYYCDQSHYVKIYEQYRAHWAHVLFIRPINLPFSHQNTMTLWIAFSLHIKDMCTDILTKDSILFYCIVLNTIYRSYATNFLNAKL